MSSYLSIESPATAELRESASKFYAFAYPVTAEEEVQELIRHLWELHPKATHICYAYRIGLDKIRFRANDDGEPAGSAGRPILGQIDAQQLSDVLVAVVRYYGGTKLGIPGLIAAYKEASILALDKAAKVTKHLQAAHQITCEIGQFNEMIRFLKQHKVCILNQEFSDKAKVVFSLNKDDESYFLKELEQIYLWQYELD
jgi:uncharacterized YigZ family protein